MNSRQMIMEIFRAALQEALPENLLRSAVAVKGEALSIAGRTYLPEKQRGVYQEFKGKLAKNWIYGCNNNPLSGYLL